MSEPEKHSEAVSRYEVSGIEERHGIIPVWLAIVYAIMFIWMIWYLVAFWTDKG